MLKRCAGSAGLTPKMRQFKVELGVVSRFEAVEELIEEIYQTIYYYNNSRMHTSLKMSPVVFKKQYEDRLQKVRITV